MWLSTHGSTYGPNNLRCVDCSQTHGYTYVSKSNCMENVRGAIAPMTECLPSVVVHSNLVGLSVADYEGAGRVTPLQHHPVLPKRRVVAVYRCPRRVYRAHGYLRGTQGCGSCAGS